MLQTIREKAQGVVAWFIVILISVPFALFGINSYLGGGSEAVVAEVNGSEISAREFEDRYRDFRQGLRQRLGDDYRPELFDENAMRAQLLESLIRERVLVQRADDLGLRVGDELLSSTVRSYPAFQVDGQFNQLAYERAVRSQGMSPAGFEAQLRTSMSSNQLIKAVRASAFATDSELKALVRLQLQQRELTYLRIPVAPLLDEVVIDESEARDYYNANQEAFMAPERVKVEYLDLDAANIAKTLESDEQALRDYYERNKTEFMAPAQRRASHILILAEEGADEGEIAKAREKAAAIYGRLQAGESFETLAKTLSEDPGSAESGGDLGYFEAGIMDPAFDEAVFSLREDEVSQPVQSSFGFHIIKLTGIREPAGKAFEEVRDEVERAQLKAKADELFYEYAEQLSNLSYEYPDSLDAAAEALNMQPQTSDWIPRTGGQGVFASPKVLAAAFSSEVLNDNLNSEAIELNNEHILVLRRIEHQEAAVRPFDEVKQVIIDQLKLAKAAETARDTGDQLLEQLQSGGDMSQLAQAAGYLLEAAKKIGRDESELPSQLVSKAFQMPRPAADKSSFASVQLGNGDVAIIELRQVIDGSEAEISKLGSEQAIKNSLVRSRADNHFEQLQENLLENADITRNLKPGEG